MAEQSDHGVSEAVGLAGARRCYLHVGLPKTGTSFLQDVVWQNRARLADQGLAMVPSRRHDHFFLALKLRGLVGEDDDPAADGVLGRLAADLREADAPRVLVSQEALAPTTPEQARPLLDLLQDFEVHVIVTVRDLARQLPSAWQQRVQSRATYTYGEFLEAVVTRAPLADDLWRNQDLGRVLESWGTLVRRDRVHLVTVPAAGSAGSLLERFCSVVGVDAARLHVDRAGGNRSLGHAQAELLRRVNVALGDRYLARQPYGRLAKGFLAQRVLQRQDGVALRLPRELESWSRSAAEAWVRQVRDGGFHLVGDEDDLRPGPASFGTVTEPTPAELVEVAARALADVLEERDLELRKLGDLRKELERQRRRVAELEGRGAGRRGVPRRVVPALHRRLRSLLPAAQGGG